MLTERVASLTSLSSWEIRPSAGVYDDVAAAMAASAAGGLVVFVPPGASVPRRLAHILVPHDGTPSTALGLDAIEDLAAGSPAEIVVLHVLDAEFAVEPGSFQGPRMVDHDGDDWYEWREEFGRRFSHRSMNAVLGLQLAVGPRTETIVKAAYRLPADLLVIAWGGVSEPDRAWTLRSVCDRAPCPVLLAATPRSRSAPLPAGAWMSSYRL
jgi:nucleotide-binding universal stress UspA family protein